MHERMLGRGGRDDEQIQGTHGTPTSAFHVTNHVPPPVSTHHDRVTHGTTCTHMLRPIGLSCHKCRIDGDGGATTKQLHSPPTSASLRRRGEVTRRKERHLEVGRGGCRGEPRDGNAWGPTVSDGAERTRECDHDCGNASGILGDFKGRSGEGTDRNSMHETPLSSSDISVDPQQASPTPDPPADLASKQAGCMRRDDGGCGMGIGSKSSSWTMGAART